MVAYESLKTKEKSSWVIHNVVAVTKFKSQRGFTEMVATRAGRLREWSQGELRLYAIKGHCHHMLGKVSGAPIRRLIH